MAPAAPAAVAEEQEIEEASENAAANAAAAADAITVDAAASEARALFTRHPCCYALPPAALFEASGGSTCQERPGWWPLVPAA